MSSAGLASTFPVVSFPTQQLLSLDCSHCTGLALIAGGAGAAVTADVVLACPVVEAGLGDTRRATPVLFPEPVRADVIFKHFSCLLVVADFLITLLLQVSLEELFQEVRTGSPPSPQQNGVCLGGWKKHCRETTL